MVTVSRLETFRTESGPAILKFLIPVFPTAIVFDSSNENIIAIFLHNLLQQI